MHFRSYPSFQLALVILIGFGSTQIFADDTGDDNLRRSAIVNAVQECQPSVVNIRGRKLVKADDSASSQAKKQVNGMGTGIVIDPRGYLLTNYHVVQGVRSIEVTTSDRQKTTAELLAHDPETDLAILKIKTRKPLPAIKIGTSSNLLLAEQVIAIGNAYGYEHTVTCLLYTSPSPRDS